MCFIKHECNWIYGVNIDAYRPGKQQASEIEVADRVID